MVAWCGNTVFLCVNFESKNENALRRLETRIYLISLISKRNIIPNMT